MDGQKQQLQWLQWVSEIQAIAQTGLTFAKDPFDKQRYESLLQLAAQMMAAKSLDSFETILSLFQSQAGYATPKIDVRGAAFKDDKVLLVKERSDQRWTLPGGYADVNCSPAFCVQKEFFEESGFEVQVKKFIGLYDKLKHQHPPSWPHTYKCFFLCEIVGGVAKPSIETSEIDFFSLACLPELSLPRVTQAQIMRCYAHALNPELPSDFE